MIKSLDLNGFKSFVSDTIDFGNLTLLTGLNSSGKSSVIQSLLMLQNAAHNKKILLEGHGGVKELTNPYSKDGVNIMVHLEDDAYIEIQNEVSNRFNLKTFPIIIYIGADRFGPETSIPIISGSDKLGKRGENIFKVIELNADKLIPEILRHPDSEGDTFLFNLRAWLGVISPNVKFESKLQEMSDSSYGTFNEHRAKNVGFGLSYSLPVITALLLGSVTPNSLVIIENPEAHLHPKGQTAIANLIGKCIDSGIQVVIETHSDHLFDGIRIYAKNSQSDFHNKVRMYWFELDNNKNTEVQAIQMDGNGRINDWPKGMFDQFEVNAGKLL